jgi:predicted TIM-barrel fold metal-dependent hydrolase
MSRIALARQDIRGGNRQRMIIDCHTHIWNSAAQLGAGAKAYQDREGLPEEHAAGPSAHAAAAACVDKTLVFGFRSAYLSADIPNDFVAEYVSRSHDGMVGVAAVDPTEKQAAAAAASCLQRKEFRGLTISPALQNFHPADTRAMGLYEAAAARKTPVFFCQGPHFPLLAKMEYARPSLLDEIAREFPNLTIVISSLGYPWVEEGIALVAKHPRVFADIAGLVRRPWQAYNAMVLAGEFRATDKILFGSDFPYGTAAAAIESIYRMNEMLQGTNLPTVPREVLRSVVERDALQALGIARAGEEPSRPKAEDEEEDF